jgi:hypothetical protein
MKLLNGERLIMFIKKYIGLVMKIKREFRFFDYVEPSNFFKTPDIDPQFNRYKVVRREEHEAMKKAHKTLMKGTLPLTITIGNSEYGSPPSLETKKPSDLIENDEQVNIAKLKNDKSDFENNNLSQSQATITEAETPGRKNMDIEVDPNDNHFLEDVKDSSDSNQNEENEFMRKKLSKINKIFNSKNDFSTISSYYQRSLEPTFEQKQSLTNFGKNGQSISNQQLLNGRLAKPSNLNRVGDTITSEERTTITTPEEHESIQLESKKEEFKKNSKNGKVEMVTDEELHEVQFDKNGIPENLEILRVPEIIRLDQRYENPFKQQGRTPSTLSSFQVKIENKPLSQSRKNAKQNHRQRKEITNTREIYHMDEVNGGRPQKIISKEEDKDIKVIDHIFDDNQDLPIAEELNKIERPVNLKQARNLWDENFGEVYSKIMKKNLI